MISNGSSADISIHHNTPFSDHQGIKHSFRYQIDIIVQN